MATDLATLFKPKPLDYYRGLTRGGNFEVALSMSEAAAVLKAHDHGIEAMDAEALHMLNRVVSKLKDQIWP